MFVYPDTIISKIYSIPSEEDVRNIYAYKKFNNSVNDENNFAINVLTKSGEQYEFHFIDSNFHLTGINLSDEAVTSVYSALKPIILTKNSVYFGNKVVNHSIENPKEMVLLWDNSLAQIPEEKLLAAVIGENGYVEILNELGTVSKFKLDVSDTNFSIAAGNLRDNETNYLIVRSSEKLLL